MTAPGLTDLPKVGFHVNHHGTVLRLILNAPPGNVLDMEMAGSLRRAVKAAHTLPHLKLLVFTGAGKHFSFGASVEEHLPAQAHPMLQGFHALFNDLMETDVPTLALVRGQCLGGGLELAAFCDWVLVEDGAHLGQPEMKLGVFAPVGSVVLPWRCGPRAGDLLLTGRTVDAAEALRIGLADRFAPAGEGDSALEAWFEENLRPLSASSLRHARKAARWELHRRVRETLPELEALYLNHLMRTHDAAEGLKAFLEKRKPSWKDA